MSITANLIHRKKEVTIKVTIEVRMEMTMVMKIKSLKIIQSLNEKCDLG